MAFKRVKRYSRRPKGTSARLRLTVFRSNTNIFAQLIDDVNGVTISSASSLKFKKGMSKMEAAKEVGRLIAVDALSKNVESIVFDRGSYIYTGRVQALADSARLTGLKF